MLHTSEITRPSKATDDRTRLFNDSSFREHFYRDMNLLLDTSLFSVIVCAIEKDKLIQKYINPEDPYHFSMENILNRSFRKARGDVIRLFPEHRDNPEDRKLELRILQMKVSGTQFYRGVEVAEKIDEFRFMKKSENHSGSQLVDLIVTPIGRHILSKTPRPGNEVDYEIIKKKITRSDDFTIFP